MQKKYKSGRRNFYQFLLCILLLMGVGYCLFTVGTHLKESDVTTQDERIALVQRKLNELGQEDRYAKMDYAKKIEQQYAGMPRSERIQTIIKVLQDLQSTVGYDESNTIKMSDFTVTLDHMTLKGEVSDLWVLYGSSENGRYTGLIDVFKGLDFVQKVHIKQYQKATDVIAFTLDATLTLGK